MLVHWFLRCQCSLLPSPAWPLQFTLIHGPNIPDLVQYCSLQHWTLLSPPDTSTTEHCFCLGPATSFFLELLVIVLQPSPAVYWTPSNVGGSSSSVIPFCLSIGFSQQEYWSSLPYPPSVNTSYRWPWTAWLRDSPRYTSCFAMTRVWSMNGPTSPLFNCKFSPIFLLNKLWSPLSSTFKVALDFSLEFC